MTFWTLTTSGAATRKAGFNFNPTISGTGSGVFLDKWSEQAEGTIVALTRRNWVAEHSTLVSGVKGILDDVASSMIAMQIISSDMSGYTSRAEAQTMLDVQDDIVKKGITILKDFKSNDIRGV